MSSDGHVRVHSTVASFAAEFERLRDEWLVVADEPDPTPGWDAELALMAAEVAALRANGVWRTGRKTLLGVLGLHHNELAMCRCLAWFLTPDAWHGLGASVLLRLLTHLDLDAEGAGDAVVAVEESRDDTRADIVVRFGSKTVLLEAKIWAGEQPTQCDRLAQNWADETPTLVFLTRAGSKPRTAIETGELWCCVAWSDVADFIEQALGDRKEIDVGALEYLRTLRTYGGSRA